MNHHTTRAALALFVSLLLPATALGRQEATQPATQPTTNPTTPTTSPWASPAFNREMTVSPAKAEDAVPPSQRADPFAFSQDALELRHENAATLYLQAFNFRGPKPEEVERVEQMPLLELSPAEVRQSFGELYSGPERRPFEIAEPAVRRTGADWGAPVNEKGIETQLPYLSEARTFARLMAMEARLLAREGKHEESADMLRRLFLLGQHLGNSREPVLVEGLVGVGVSALALDRAAQISQLPDAPNRYWALTTLPAPMFDINRWMRSERIFLTVSLPALRNPEHVTAEEYFQTLRTLRTFMSGNESGSATIGQLLEDTAATAQLAAQAGPYLKARGYTDEQLEAMGMHAVIATYMMDDYRARFDAMTKLVYLPFPQALPLLAAEERRMTEGGGEPGPGLLAEILLPALTRAVAAPYRLERQIGALRIVEAVRDHAAHHDGALPASLAELRLPIPEDPMTGEPFGYAVSGNMFTLTAPRYLESDHNSSLEWRVTMRR